jgi:hypothetical protein
MNRRQEYYELLSSLENTPAELNFTMTRVGARIKKVQRKQLLWKTALTSFLTLVIIFVVTVNAFPTVAFALSNVPILGSLVRAVSFDPSMKKAVENNYAQYVGLEKTVDDVTVKIEYLIVDAQRISVFYSCTKPDTLVLNSMQAFDKNDEHLVAGISYKNLSEDKDGLNEARIDLGEDQLVPEELTFTLSFCKADKRQVATIRDEVTPSEVVSELSFRLNPDPQYAKTVKTIEINKELMINGQKIKIERLDIFPTQAKLLLICAENNSAYIKGLDLWLEDDKGNRYEPKNNGITATFSSDNENVASLWIESSYFAKTQTLKLCINGIQMIAKDALFGVIDYQTGTITNLPKDVRVEEISLQGNNLHISLVGKSPKPNHTFQIAGWEYWHGDEKCSFGSRSSTTGDDEYHFIEMFEIKEFDVSSQYKLKWNYGPIEALKEPISITLYNK